MKEDIEIIRHALQSAKANAFLHRRGGLHNLWDKLVEGLQALKRIEALILPHQPSLMPMITRPEPDTISPSSKPKHKHDTADYKRGA